MCFSCFCAAGLSLNETNARKHSSNRGSEIHASWQGDSGRILERAHALPVKELRAHSPVFSPSFQQLQGMLSLSAIVFHTKLPDGSCPGQTQVMLTTGERSFTTDESTSRARRLFYLMTSTSPEKPESKEARLLIFLASMWLKIVQSVKNVKYADLDGYSSLKKDITTGGLELKNGENTVSGRPGSGLDVSLQ